jgi:hypothetical protein
MIEESLMTTAKLSPQLAYGKHLLLHLHHVAGAPL